MKPLLKVAGLRVSYRTRRIIEDFEFELQHRSCTALVGYSGCGKSTVLKALVGLVRADGGDGWLNSDQFLDKGSITVHPWSLRRQLTLVTQQSGLLPHKTVLDNIILGTTLITGLSKGVAIRRTEDMAARLGVADKLRSYPNQLSGGELQRAHLARALVLEPTVFLLDEVTSNVDPRTSESIGMALKYLREGLGASIVLVSHDFAAVKSLADRIIFLHEGKNFEEVSGESFPGGFKTAEARAFTTESGTRSNHA